jgi:hypothetical protein
MHDLSFSIVVHSIEGTDDYIHSYFLGPFRESYKGAQRYWNRNWSSTTARELVVEFPRSILRRCWKLNCGEKYFVNDGSLAFIGYRCEPPDFRRLEKDQSLWIYFYIHDLDFFLCVCVCASIIYNITLERLRWCAAWSTTGLKQKK